MNAELHTIKTPQELFEILHALGIAYTHYYHDPMRKACTDEQAQKLRLDIPGLYVKNLFLKDGKNKLWLIVMPEIKRVELKVIALKIDVKQLSFANNVLLMRYLGVQPGSVTPLGLINDVDKRILVVVDKDCMCENVLNFHPLKNDETIGMASSDFEKFLHYCGNSLAIVEFLPTTTQ
jgi:Ala-tRNA(Pro) deacylase